MKYLRVNWQRICTSETGQTAELIKYTYGITKFSRTNKFNKSNLCNFSQKLRVLTKLWTFAFKS